MILTLQHRLLGPLTSLHDVATLGSRLFACPAQSHRVGCFVLAGRDFPDAVREQLSAWAMSLTLRVSEDSLSTRGLLEYEDDTFGRESSFSVNIFIP